jgi:hypothetical protein
VQVHIYQCANIECNKLEVLIDAGFDNRMLSSNFQADSFDYAESVFSQRIFPQNQGGRPELNVDEVPGDIFRDYDEACKIIQLSPRASATLARRCIQNMVRTKFGVKPDNLKREIQALRETTEPVREEIIVIRSNIFRHGLAIS